MGGIRICTSHSAAIESTLSQLSKWVSSEGRHVNSEGRAERLLAQLQRWAMEALERPRDERPRFIEEVAAEYYEDALKNGLSQSQAEDWRESVNDWLSDLVNVIETSGGASGGHG